MTMHYFDANVRDISCELTSFSCVIIKCNNSYNANYFQKLVETLPKKNEILIKYENCKVKGIYNDIVELSLMNIYESRWIVPIEIFLGFRIYTRI